MYMRRTSIIVQECLRKHRCSLNLGPLVQPAHENAELWPLHHEDRESCNKNICAIKDEARYT